MISCQVCRRTMRWHNGPIRRSRNPNPSQVFQDWSNKWEESAAHSILARSPFTPTKAVYMSADQPCPSHFSLAIRRRTIHSDNEKHSIRRAPTGECRAERGKGRVGALRIEFVELSRNVAMGIESLLGRWGIRGRRANQSSRTDAVSSWGQKAGWERLPGGSCGAEDREETEIEQGPEQGHRAGRG